jgi:galactonate dehydratase
MKIVDLQSVVVGNPWKNWVFCQLYTDDGLVGLGEATAGMKTLAVVGALTELKDLCIGEDPRDIKALQQKLRKALYLPEDGVIHHALAGIDIACWDILGKSVGAPLYRLLGGKVQTKLRAYANGWYRGPRTPEDFAHAAQQVVAAGYTALKFDPFGNAYKNIAYEEEAMSLSIVAAVRAAVGDSVDIIIEAHDRFSIDTAVRLGRKLDQYHPLWLEAPVLSTDIAALHEVARRIPCPVAAGERLVTLRQCNDLLANNVISTIQPEVMGLGGITPLVESFHLAAAYNAMVAPHSAASPLCTAINVHVGISQPNTLIQECFDGFQDADVTSVLTGCPQVVNGFLEPSAAPGLGVTLDMELAERFPYHAGNVIRLFESGWERRSGSNRT